VEAPGGTTVVAIKFMITCMVAGLGLTSGGDTWVPNTGGTLTATRNPKLQCYRFMPEIWRYNHTTETRNRLISSRTYSKRHINAHKRYTEFNLV
jgi:hypothetical protein